MVIITIYIAFTLYWVLQVSNLERFKVIWEVAFTVENSIEVCQKLQVELPEVPLLGIFPPPPPPHTQKAPVSRKDTCTLMDIAPFFFLAFFFFKQ